MGQIQVDDMTSEILCTELRDFRPKSIGAVFKNVFCTNRPHGGARRGACQTSASDWASKECVCAKFGIDRGNGSGDNSRAKSVT